MCIKQTRNQNNTRSKSNIIQNILRSLAFWKPFAVLGSVFISVLFQGEWCRNPLLGTHED